MKVKKFNGNFSTQQNFAYGTLLLIWQELNKSAKDLCEETSDITFMEALRLKANCNDYSIDLTPLIIGDIKLSSLRTYYTQLLQSSTSPEMTAVFRAIKIYLSKVHQEAHQGEHRETLDIDIDGVVKVLFRVFAQSSLELRTALSLVGKRYSNVTVLKLRIK